MDISLNKVKKGWRVVSVGILNLGGIRRSFNTQLDLVFQNNLNTSRAEDDDSEDNSTDENQPPTSAAEVKKVKETLDASLNVRPPPIGQPKRKDRTLSFNDDLLMKPSSATEMADFIIYPDGPLSYYWMSLVTITVMYNIAVIILRLAFSEIRDQRLFYILDNACDALYLLDIVVQSRTAFLADGCLVLDPHAMFINYKKKFKFWLDLVATFPVTTVYWIGSFFVNVIMCNFDALLVVTPMPALRFLRILKYHQLATFFEIADSRTRKPSLLRAFKLSLHLWVVIHWIACIYYMVSEVEGLGSNEWVYTEDEDGGFRRKYIRSVYWSMMTLTTIGERPSPVTDLEYIFTGTTFLIGVFVFAAVVGNVGDVISNMNAARHDFQARMDQIKFYMNHRSVPEILQDRVKKWAEYSWNRTQAMDEPSVLAMLPDRLRTEIAIHVHLETLKQVKIFEECEEGLLRELVLKLRPQIYSPGDYICRTGEIGREMYIINHGKIEILVPKDDSTTRVALLTSGNYFGEISLLKLDEGQNRRTADVRAIGYSELLCLSRKDLISALGEYPGAKKILEDQAKERMQQTKGMRQQTTESCFGNKPVLATGKRRAKDVFSDVMKQEGFRKLLSSRDNEMSELKKLVEDMKTISQKQRNDPALSALEDKCRTLEQRLLTKDLAFKQAKRRINQLETYVRIRAYNAKLRVPESDPEVIRSGQNIPFVIDREIFRRNAATKFLSCNSSGESDSGVKMSISQVHSTCGPTSNYPRETSSDTHVPRHNGVTNSPSRRTNMIMAHDNRFHIREDTADKVHSPLEASRSSGDYVGSRYAVVTNGNFKSKSNATNVKQHIENDHGTKSPEDDTYPCPARLSKATITLAEGEKINGEQSKTKLRRLICNMKHSSIQTSETGTSDNKSAVPDNKQEDIVSSTSAHDKNITDRPSVDNKAASAADDIDLDKSLLKVLNKNSRNDDTVDSGISDRDFLQEDEELLKLMELFGKDNSIDSTTSHSNSDNSNSDFSSGDEIDL